MMKERREPVRKPVPWEPRVQQRGRVGGREKVERQVPGQALGRKLLLHRLQPRPRERDIDRTIGEHEQQPARTGAARHQPDEVHRRVVAPVEIVEEEHERRIGSQRLERLGDLTEHAVGRRAKSLVLQRIARLDERRHLGQPRRRVPSQQGGDASAPRIAREPSERVEHRQVRFGAAGVLQALTLRDPGSSVLLDLPQEGVDDARLADPAFPDHEHDLTLAGERSHERRMQRHERAVASNQRCPGHVERRCTDGVRGAGSIVGRRRVERRRGRHWRNEAIPDPPCRVHEPRRRRIVPESAANLTNRDLQHRIADVDSRPDVIEQLVFGDDPVHVASEVIEHAVGLRGQPDGARALPQQLRPRIEAE